MFCSCAWFSVFKAFTLVVVGTNIAHEQRQCSNQIRFSSWLDLYTYNIWAVIVENIRQNVRKEKQYCDRVSFQKYRFYRLLIKFISVQKYLRDKPKMEKAKKDGIGCNENVIKPMLYVIFSQWYEGEHCYRGIVDSRNDNVFICHVIRCWAI